MEKYTVGGAIHIKVSGEFMDADIDLTRISQNVAKAQRALDIAVMTSMEGVMPRQTGQFIQLTKARSAAMAGSGRVMAAAPPFGRFLYYGKVMIDPLTGSMWARRGSKKVATDRNLKFWYPKARPRWFEVAKTAYLPQWIDTVRKKLNERK